MTREEIKNQNKSQSYPGQDEAQKKEADTKKRQHGEDESQEVGNQDRNRSRNPYEFDSEE